MARYNELFKFGNILLNVADENNWLRQKRTMSLARKKQVFEIVRYLSDSGLIMMALRFWI